MAFQYTIISTEKLEHVLHLNHDGKKVLEENSPLLHRLKLNTKYIVVLIKIYTHFQR